jgi:predicted AAA+ superfamily ATPase
MKPKAALRQAYNYVDAICNTDISRVDGVRRESAFCRRLLRSYARHSGTSASLNTLYADIVANESSSMNENTIASYLQALRKIFVVEDMPAWNPNLRSKSAIRTSDTRYFVDPSVATSALGIGPNDLSNDLKSFGFIFETLAVRDLRVYAEALDGEVFHFRDRNGLECDAVVHLRNGSYGLVEVKIGGEKLIEEGASSLKSLAGKIDTERMKKPSFMMVLTGIGTYAYKREDGVYVVPVCALKD